jgi:hypothetical protein
VYCLPIDPCARIRVARQNEGAECERHHWITKDVGERLSEQSLPSPYRSGVNLGINSPFFAPTPNKTLVPMSIVYRNDLYDDAKSDGENAPAPRLFHLQHFPFYDDAPHRSFRPFLRRVSAWASRPPPPPPPPAAPPRAVRFCLL